MWPRRSFYYAQFGVIPILPLWLLVGRGIVIDGTGWGFVLLLFVSPILALAMIIVLGLTLARKSVRVSHAVSWLDVGLLGAWYLTIIAAGFIAYPGAAALVVVLALAVFWSAVWQLFTETRRRVENVFASLNAVPAGEYRASTQTKPDARGTHQVIRIEPTK